jgi:hypothetical protein
MLHRVYLWNPRNNLIHYLNSVLNYNLSKSCRQFFFLSKQQCQNNKFKKQELLRTCWYLLGIMISLTLFCLRPLLTFRKKYRIILAFRCRRPKGWIKKYPLRSCKVNRHSKVMWEFALTNLLLHLHVQLQVQKMHMNETLLYAE